MSEPAIRLMGRVGGLILVLICGCSNSAKAIPDSGSSPATRDSAAITDIGQDTHDAETGGDASTACVPTLHGQACPTNGEVCSYTGHQCHCVKTIWVCSLCPAQAPNKGASCADITSTCTYGDTQQCTCGGVPLPTWSCTP